jgi:hypothetical protein
MALKLLGVIVDVTLRVALAAELVMLMLQCLGLDSYVWRLL